MIAAKGPVVQHLGTELFVDKPNLDVLALSVEHSSLVGHNLVMAMLVHIVSMFVYEHEPIGESWMAVSLTSDNHLLQMTKQAYRKVRRKRKRNTPCSIARRFCLCYNVRCMLLMWLPFFDFSPSHQPSLFSFSLSLNAFVTIINECWQRIAH